MSKINGPWRCFHCGQVCATEAHAREHFGGVKNALTACEMRSGDTHLIDIIRDQEQQLASYRADDSDALRAYRALERDQARLLREAEQRGYSKGVADMKAQGYAITLPLPDPAPSMSYSGRSGICWWCAN